MTHFWKFLDFLHFALATKHVPKASWHVPNGAGGARSGFWAPLTPNKTISASAACKFPKTTFSPKMDSRSAPGASPWPPRTPTGRPLSLPGSPGEVPEHVFHQKLCQNGAKCMKNGICHGLSKSPRIFITFCMDFGSFSVVFFVTFFGRAFSKKCRCCKVRHARILWFLQWILTMSTFHVFLAKAKKSQIPARISMQKT